MLSNESSKIQALVAVFLLSLAMLAYEVLLTRIFSITQWNHLSFMVISIALFGFALSGTFLSICESRLKENIRNFSLKHSIKILIVLYSISAVTSFIALNAIPLDYFRLPFEFIQIICLLAAYLVLTLPFFFAGLVISICYTYIPEKTGLIYFASMVGSACGALAPAFLLPFWGEERIVVLIAVVPLALIILKNPFKNTKQTPPNKDFPGSRVPMYITALGIISVSIFLVSSSGYFLIGLKPSPYKSLSQHLRLPNTEIKATNTALRAKIDKLESPYIRFAPGMSLKFTDTLPQQSALFRDGDNPFILYDLVPITEGFFARYTLTYSGYALHPNPESILLVQNGGGLGVLCALSSGSRNITIIEQNPYIARNVRNQYHLPVVNQNPRSYLASSPSKYSIIHVENWGTSIPAANALNQEHLFTLEAFTEYLRHLAPGGLLILSRKLLLPPSDSIRLWATAYESLRGLKIKNPQRHIAVLRNWDTFVLLVSTRPFQDISRTQSLVDKYNFDIVYQDGISFEMANRFNVFKSPYYYLTIKQLERSYRFGKEKKFFSGYLLDVKPQGDSRPFPNRFLKWSKLHEIYKSTGSRIYSLLMSGEIVVLTVFMEAVVISIFLLILPLLLTVKKVKESRHILYFLSIGMGFMFLEIYYIKALTLLFGNPIISLTVVLTGVLAFSGLGGIYSYKFNLQRLKYILVATILLLAISLFCFSIFIPKILALSKPLQYFLALMLILPSGVLIGMPFPLGMRCLLKHPEQRAYAWAANGCASVLTAIVSAQIAISVGIPAVMLCAVFSYLLAFLCVVRLNFN